MKLKNRSFIAAFRARTRAESGDAAIGSPHESRGPQKRPIMQARVDSITGRCNNTKLPSYCEDRAHCLTIHMVGDGPGKPGGQVGNRIPMCSHDDGGGMNAHCRTENAVSRVAGFDKMSDGALLSGVRRNECIQMC